MLDQVKNCLGLLFVGWSLAAYIVLVIWQWDRMSSVDGFWLI